MKTSNSPFRRFLSLPLATALVLLPGRVMGGEKNLEPPAATTASNPAGYELQIVDGQLIRPGGKVEATLPNVVDALRDQHTEANISLAPGLAQVKVGDLKLRAARLEEELEAVRVASGDKFEVQSPGPQAPIDPNTGLPTKPNSGLFVLRQSRPTPQTQRIVEAFNIGPYLEWLGHRPNPAARPAPEDEALEEIIKVLHDTISDLQQDAEAIDQPKMQYHRGSTLLVVIGTVDSVEVARKIISALPGMPGAGGESAMGRTFKPGDETAAQRAMRERADDAFRARYGLSRRAVSPGQPSNTPEAGPPN